MDEAQVRTLEQVRQVVPGTQALEFRRAEDDAKRYAWIGSVLRRFDYGRLRRADRGMMRVYLQRLSGYSRAQVQRLVARWRAGEPLVKHDRAPAHAFARRYTAADVALLIEVDRAMGTLSGPATACVLRRQRDRFKDARFERLGSLSVGHLYNLRNSAGYRRHKGGPGGSLAEVLARLERMERRLGALARPRCEADERLRDAEASAIALRFRRGRATAV